MEIRELTAAEQHGATRLWEKSGLTRPWNPPDDDFDRAVAGPTSAVLGGFEDDALVATAMVGHDGHRGWVYYLAVDPERTRRGRGRQMMTAAESWLRHRGVVKLNVMMRRDQGAESFYRALGYEDSDVMVFARWLHESRLSGG